MKKDLVFIRENGKAKMMKYEVYDDNNNLIYVALPQLNPPDMNRFGWEIYILEQWFEYDKNGKLIHMKDSEGYEEWFNHDKNCNLVKEHILL